MIDKLKSRKLLVAVASTLLVVLTDVCGADLDPDTYWAVIGIVSAYVLGQSIVDAKK